jgi:beta-galactosidase
MHVFEPVAALEVRPQLEALVEELGVEEETFPPAVFSRNERLLARVLLGSGYSRGACVGAGSMRTNVRKRFPETPMNTPHACWSRLRIILSSCLLMTGVVSAREVVSLDAGWRFFQGEAKAPEKPKFDDSDWEKVDVPHDWSIAGPFKQDAKSGGAGGWLPTGVAWYRREFEAPEKRGAVWLEFDGVMERSEVWLNGESVGGWPYGYTRFRCDVTDRIKNGSNLLVVKADTSKQPASRWYSGSGIYRHVRLVATDAAHFSPDGVFVTTPEIGGRSAVVEAKVGLSAAAAGLGFRGRVVGPDEKVVAEAAGKDGVIRMEVPRPQLWSVETPVMYRLELALVRGGATLDRVDVPFGIRAFEFRADTGFWLNGKNFKLKGVCLHHDGGGVGAAVPLAVWERRLTTLKEIGVNAIRTAHNPVDPGFLDLCDTMGFLVMNEAFDCWTRGKNRHDYHEFFTDWWERDLRSMVRRDRNHPSIVLYSVGNEIRDTHDTEKAKAILADLVRVCHEEDPTRPVTQALFRPNTTKDYDNGLADLLDKPSRKIVGTEHGHERSTWLICRDNPQHSGQFLWSGIDYLGEARDWPVTTYNSGLLDRTGVPHPRGWERMSWWSEKPMVKAFRRVAPTEATPPDPGYEVIEWKRRQVLFPDWNPEREGEQNVEVYTNAEEVELFLDKRSLGKKTVRKDHALNWTVPFESGTLRAVARSKGREVAVDELRTAGEPAKIRITADREGLAPGFENVAHLTIHVVDKEGVPVPNASHRVKLSVEGAGRLIAYDNGSITSHDSFHSDEREVFQGRSLAIIRATAAGGSIEVRATSEGLEASTITIKAAPAAPR